MAKAFEIAFKLAAKIDSKYSGVFKKAEKIASKCGTKISSTYTDVFKKAEKIASKCGTKIISTYDGVSKKVGEITSKMASSKYASKMISTYDNVSKKVGKISKLVKDAYEKEKVKKNNNVDKKPISKDKKSNPIDESSSKKLSKNIKKIFTNSFDSIQNLANKTIEKVKKTIDTVGKVINTYKDFEQSMTNTAVIAGVEKGTEIYSKLEKAALDAGKVTSKTAKESAKALGYMSLAGWSAEESIQGLLPILKLSEVTGAELAGTTDLITNSMSKMGIKTNQIARYLDIVAKANNKSNQTSMNLLEAYTSVGDVFKNLNIDITESSALFGVLASHNIKGATAGNKMSETLVNLTNQSGESSEAMKKLGVKAYDSQGNFKGVTKVLEDLNAKTKNLTKEQRNNYLTMIGGKSQLDTLNALMSGLNTTNAEGVNELAALQREFENATGSLDNMADAVNNTMTGAITRLNSAMDDFKINMVKQLEPIITPIINKIADSIPKITEAIVKTTTNAKNLGKAFTDGFKNMKSDGVVKAFFPMFEQAQATLPSLFGEKIGNAMIGSLSRTISKTDKVFEKLKPRMPLIEASAKYFTDNFSIGVGKFLNGDSLSTAFSESLKGLRGILNQVFEGGTGLVIFDNIKSGIDKVSKVIETVKTGFSEISKAYSESFGAIAPEIKTFIDKIMDAFGEIDDDTLSIFSTVFNSIKDIIVEVAPIIADVISIAMDRIGSIIDIVAIAVKMATPCIKSIIEFVKEFAKNVLEFVGSVVDNWDIIEPIIIGFGSAFLIVSGAIAIWSGVCGIATAVTTGLASATTFLAGAVTFLTSPIGLVILAIGAVIMIGVLLYKNWDKIKEYFSEKFPGIFENIKLVFSNIIDFFKNIFTGNWQEAWENVKNIFSGAFGALEAIAKAPLNAIITLINKAIDGLNSINITLPDFMGGGNFGLNIPQIPMLAKGSNYTPDTFIAGEKGAELVTNRAGSKVFNALETGSIFKNLSNYDNLNLTQDYDTSTKSTMPSITPINTNNSSSVTIQYNPIVNIDGESSDKENLKYLIQDALKNHIQEVKKIVIDTIGSIHDRKVRLSNE